MPDIIVRVPEDPALVQRIHRMIEFVVNFGSSFEASMMERELKNPDYAFLFDSRVSVLWVGFLSRRLTLASSCLPTLTIAGSCTLSSKAILRILGRPSDASTIR